MGTQMKLIALIIFASLLSACAEVKPWQRDKLAKPEMTFNDDALGEQLDKQIYNSKEAAHGGGSVSGGGCGCN